MNIQTWPIHDVIKGLESGLLYEALFCINPKKNTEAFARINKPYLHINVVSGKTVAIEINNDVFISEEQYRNNAIDGDIVAVKLFNYTAWPKCPKNRKMCTCDSNKTVCPTIQPTGIVVHILKRTINSFVCKLSTKKANAYLATPVNTVYPHFHIFENNIDIHSSLLDQDSLYEIKLLEWPSNSLVPYGRIIRKLGIAGDCTAEEQALLIEFRLSETLKEFDADVVNYCKVQITKINEMANQLSFDHLRENLVHLNVVTIDPISAKDLDDGLSIRLIDFMNGEILSNNYYANYINNFLRDHTALSIERCKQFFNGLPNSTIIEVGVHIADVSQIVTQDSPIEPYIVQRPCTIYFPNKAIHMLPSCLSEDVLSLNSGTNKITFTLFIYFNTRLEIINVKYAKAVINVKYNLNYSTVQNLFDNCFGLQDEPTSNSTINSNTHSPSLYGNKNSNNYDCKNILNFNDLPNNPKYNRQLLSYDLISMLLLSRILNDDRTKAGSVELDSESNLIIDEVNEDITEIDQQLSHSLVAELMLLANKTVAQILINNFPTSTVLRCHPPIQESKLKKFFQNIKHLIDDKLYNLYSNTNEIGKFLKDAKLLVKPQILLCIKHYLILSLECATYKVYNQYDMFIDEKTNVYRHWALNFDFYTHFTSPIRRYPDVLVHRQLAALYNSSEYKPLNFNYLNSIIGNVSTITYNAKRLSEKAIYIWYFIESLKSSTYKIEKGYVYQILDMRAEIYIPAIHKILSIDYHCSKDNNRLAQCFDLTKIQNIELWISFNYDTVKNTCKFNYSDHSSTTLSVGASVYVYLVQHKNIPYTYKALLVPSKLLKEM